MDAAAVDDPMNVTRVRLSRAVRWIRRLLVLALVAYFASTVPGVRGHAGFNVFLDGWVQSGLIVVASLLTLARSVASRTDRAAWAMIGVGIALYAIGQIVYVVWVQYLDPLPYPSVADGFWLAFYVFPYIGLVLLVRRRVRMFHASIWLDGVVGALGAAACASPALTMILRQTGGEPSAVITTLAYPVGDLLLLVLIVGIYGLLGWRPDRSWLYLGVGLVLFAAADTIYLLRVATGSYQAGTMLDPIWVVGCVVIALGALRPPTVEEPIRLEGWRVLLVPSLFTVTSLGLLVYGGISHLPNLSIGLAAAAVLCGLTRAAMTFREVQAVVDNRREARTDELTGLGNRRRFYEALQARIDTGGASRRFAVMIIDLDRFKEVNDSLGHPVGDRLLVEVGQRLAEDMRASDVLVRLGGDEFAVLFDSPAGESVGAVAERLLTKLQHVFAMDGLLLHVDASIGIAVYPDVADTADGLLQRADIAMYEAKTERLGCVVYERGDDDDLTARIHLVQELRTAINEGQLLLHYQPKIDVRTGALAGVEALVRWQHPERGLLYPDSFIPAAERSGFMRRLTTVVLAMALDQVSAWLRAGTLVTVAVNVSASNLLDVDLPVQIEAMLASRGLPPHALTLEITESTLMVDHTRSLAVLHRLHDQGIRISIDDYGTGYSSLSYLRDLPVDELKLDRSFIGELDSDPRAVAIVESTVRLAHSLGLLLVAEGIETADAWQRLTEMGCDLGQGYFLSRPVPAEQLTPWLAPQVLPV
jgi:diguanylate cyclase (GGDEF)-like protein